MAYSNTGDHDYQMILSYHELYQIIDNLKHIPKLLKMLSILDGDLVIINRK